MSRGELGHGDRSFLGLNRETKPSFCTQRILEKLKYLPAMVTIGTGTTFDHKFVIKLLSAPETAFCCGRHFCYDPRHRHQRNTPSLIGAKIE